MWTAAEPAAVSAPPTAREKTAAMRPSVTIQAPTKPDQVVVPLVECRYSGAMAMPPAVVAHLPEPTAGCRPPVVPRPAPRFRLRAVAGRSVVSDHSVWQAATEVSDPGHARAPDRVATAPALTPPEAHQARIAAHSAAPVA